MASPLDTPQSGWLAVGEDQRTYWELIIEEHEGHGGPEMVRAWRDANDRLAGRLGE